MIKKAQIMKNVIAIILLCTHVLVYGQLQVGREPEIPSAQTWEFIKYGNAKANLHTGMVSVSVPFYTYKDKDFEIPISFDYASDGYKPNSLSGILGHDWVLNAGGCITREVRGVPDDTHGYVQMVGTFTVGEETFTGGSPCNGFYFLSKKNFPEDNYVNMTYDARDNVVFYRRIVDTAYDVDPDIFHFNFMGYSGSFYFGYNNQVHVYHTNTYNEEFKIEMNITTYVGSMDPYQNDNGFWFASSIAITTGDGYKYFFGDPNPEPNDNKPYDYKDIGKFCFKGIDYKTQKNPLMAPGNPAVIPVVNTWKLTKITAPNGRTVKFNYGEDGKEMDSYKVVEYHPVSTKYQANMTTRLYNNPPLPWLHFDETLHCSFPSLENRQTTLKIDSIQLYTDYLTSINIDDAQIIKFFYKTIKSESVKHVGNSWDPNIIKQIKYPYLKLDSIDTPWKNCTFRYKFSEPDNPNLFGHFNKIPFLDSINISGEGSYVFEYYNRTNREFPYIGSFSLDHWGYYNGRNNPFNPIDLAEIYTQDIYYQTETILRKYETLREPAPDCALMGMLGWMKYPTGGYTVLQYEPHKYSTALRRVFAYDYAPTLINTLPERTAGGLRIKQIDNYTDNNTLAESTTYLYEKEVGLSSGTLIHFPRYGIVYLATAETTQDDWTLTGNKTYSYHSLSDIWHYDKSHIEYSKITEKKNDNSKIIHYYPEYIDKQNNFLNNGITANAPSKICNGGSAYFAIENIYNNTPNGLWVRNILTPEQSMFFERNKLKRKEILDSNNTLLRSEEWNNNAHISHISRKTFSVIGEKILISTIHDNDYSISESATNNYASGRDNITENAIYSYNTAGQVNSIFTIDSKRNENKIEYSYVSDLINPAGIYIAMQAQNLKSYPISEKRYIKKKDTNNFVLTEGKQYTYKFADNSSQTVVPAQIDLYNNETGLWETGITHNHYDIYGNILESENRNGIKTVYLWGYEGKYLVAKINNCSLSDVEAIPALANIKVNQIQGNISSYEVALRAIPEAEVTSFYYEQFSRLTKIIDPSGRAIEYDFKNSQHGKIGEIFNELGIFTKYNYSTDEN